MKFLLSLSLIPLLLLTNVSAAEELPLPTNEQENSPFHEYENPTTPDGLPLLALHADEPNAGWNSETNFEIIQKRAGKLCRLLDHKERGTVFEKDVQYYFEGKAYFDGDIVDVKKTRSFYFLYLSEFEHKTNAIFKVLRCVD